MDKFDLEQAIMVAWTTSEDIKLLLEAVCERVQTTDEIANVLIGIQSLHDMRCQKLFDIYETLIRERKFM